MTTTQAKLKLKGPPPGYDEDELEIIGVVLLDTGPIGLVEQDESDD